MATAEADGTCVQYPSTVFEPCCTEENTDRSGFSRSVYPPSAAIWARGQRSAAHVGVASPMTIARVPVTVALIYKGHVSNVFHIGFQMMF